MRFLKDFLNSTLPPRRPRFHYIAICAVFVATACCAQARLGENLPQLTKRYGNPTDSEQHPGGGLGLRFHDPKQGYDVIVNLTRGVSVGENYFCTTPLTSDGLPPTKVVRGFLESNAPGAKWLDTPANGEHHDVGFITESGQYAAWISNHGAWFNKGCTFVVGI